MGVVDGYAVEGTGVGVTVGCDVGTALGTALLLGSLALIAWAVALQFEKNQRTGRMLRALQRGGGDGAGGDAVRRASAMLGMDARSAMTRAKSDLESSLDRAERQHAGHEESFYGGELLDRVQRGSALPGMAWCSIQTCAHC